MSPTSTPSIASALSGAGRMLLLLGTAIGCIACNAVRATSPGVTDGTTDTSPDGLARDDASSLSTPISCRELPVSCGADHRDSCCASPLVPGGAFARGYDVAADLRFGDLTHPATVSDFRLDRYEITVGRFRAFLQAGCGTQATAPRSGAGAHSNIAGSGWDPAWNRLLPASTPALIALLHCDSGLETWTDAPSRNEDRPINCISWYDAMAFCIWDQGYLPTEAQWNYAAAGGEEQRAYPWSQPASSLALDAAHASYFDGEDCVGDGLPGCALDDLVAVGSDDMGHGRWGHSELAGNLLEWTLDWFAAYPTPCDDCANLTPVLNRAIRGGSFSSIDRELRTGARVGLRPTDRNSLLGARCARAP